MTADWPAKIEAAQLLTHYTIGGHKHPRVRFGEDDRRVGQNACPGCGVLKGQLHVPGCRYEKCPACGQRSNEGCICDTVELREPNEEQAAPTAQRPMVRWLVAGLGCVLILLLIFWLWTVFIVSRK